MTVPEKLEPEVTVAGTPLKINWEAGPALTVTVADEVTADPDTVAPNATEPLIVPVNCPEITLGAANFVSVKNPPPLPEFDVNPNSLIAGMPDG